MVIKILIIRTSERKEKIEQTILGIIEERERTNFIVRFILRNYDSWHKVGLIPTFDIPSEYIDAGNANIRRRQI